MGFSKQYIKMCKEAKEIQEIYQNILKKEDNEVDNILEGWYVYDGKNVILLHNNEFFISDLKDELKKYIWLPRQDQLQAIITTNKYFRFSLIELFYHFANKNISKFTSMEQLWLAYVMYIKYKKIWNNEKEKWVKEKD